MRAPSPDKIRLDPPPERPTTWVDVALWVVLLAGLWQMLVPFVIPQAGPMKASDLLVGALVVLLAGAVAFRRGGPA